MKTLIYGRTLYLWGILLFWVGCSSPLSLEKPILEQTSLPEELQAPTLTNQTTVGGLLLPDNSMIEVSEDQSEVTFTFPENIFFVREDEEGNPVMMRQIKYQCDCSGSGGCVVFHSGNSFGCLHGTCTGTCTGYFTDDGGSGHHRFSGGFVDLNQESNFIYKNDENSPLLAFHPIILELAETKDAMTLLDAMPLGYQVQGFTGPSKVVAFNFLGTQIGVQVPISFIESKDDPSAYKEVSCRCNSGTSGCVLQQLPDSNIWLCVGQQCSSCAMIVEDDGGGSH